MIANIKNKGFTIIELLVVIVIVGIVSSLAINGVASARDRASNVRTISGISSYRDAIIAYAVDNSDYPWDWNTCLGLGYEDVSGDGIGDCVWPADRTWGTPENEFFMNRIAEYAGTSEPVNDDENTWFSERSAGALLLYDDFDTFMIDGEAAENRHYIRYNLKGHETDCGFPALGVDGYWLNFITENPNSYTLTSATQNSTLCLIELPPL